MGLISVALWSLFLLQMQPSPEHSDPFAFQFEKIREGIYLGYRPEPLRYLVEGNVIVIVNRDDVVVVDATGSPQGARMVIEQIGRLTDKPISVLINTHGHGDHTIGNHTFLQAYPELEIIAHPGARDYLTRTEGGINYVHDLASGIDSRVAYIDGEIQRVETEAYPGYQKVIANLRQYRDHDLLLRQKTYQDVTIAPPTLTVTDRLSLHRGEREIRVLFLGRGDTASDLWVYLPKEGILCSGDAVVHPIPYGFSRHGVDWLQTLKAAEQLDFDLLIPGHGAVQHGKPYLRQYIDLLSSVQTQLQRGISARKSKQDVISGVDINELETRFTGGDALLRYYFHSYFKTPHLERTYSLLAPPESASRWETVTSEDGLPPGEVRAVLAASDGSVWFSVRGLGLARRSGDVWSYFSTETGLVDNGIAALKEFDETIWAVGRRGYSILEKGEWTGFSNVGGEETRVVFSASSTRSGAIWLGAVGFAARKDESGWTHLTTTQGLPHAVVHQVHQDRLGRTWLACRRGLARMEGNSIEVLYPEENFRSIVEDREGALWFGTGGSGIFELKDGEWKRHFEGRTVLPTALDSRGRVWARTEGDGAFYRQNGEWVQLTAADGLLSDVIYDIAPVPDGSIWFGTDRGAVLLRSPPN